MLRAAVLVLVVTSAISLSAGGVSTVNSYTPAQEANARQAAMHEGFEPGPVLFAQAGNFFFNGTKNGHSYPLTVTPQGRVYAGAAN